MRKMKKKEERLEEREFKIRKSRLKEGTLCQDLRKPCLVEVMRKKWIMSNDLCDFFYNDLFLNVNFLILYSGQIYFKTFI